MTIFFRIIFLFFLSINLAAAAQVRVDKEISIVFLDGEIVKGDLIRVKKAFDYIEKEGQHSKFDFDILVYISLNSPGGDVQEAIKIGEYLREKKKLVVVGEGAICYSSCVYIIAGGYKRQLWFDYTVGIHRPFFTSDNSKNLDSAMKEMMKVSELYFKKMNINPALAQDMFSILPQDMRLLSKAELSKYRLNQDDITYQEETDARMAKLYGMTRVEYYAARRKADADILKFCGV